MPKSSPSPGHRGKQESGSRRRRVSPELLALADGLNSAAIHLLRQLRKQDVSTGEGPARLSALSVLVFGGPKTLGQLAAAEQVRPSTMSRIVAGLAHSGLIRITPDAADARRMRIQASAKGIRLLQAARQKRVGALAEQLRRLPPQDFAALRLATEVLRRLLAEWQ